MQDDATRDTSQNVGMVVKGEAGEAAILVLALVLSEGGYSSDATSMSVRKKEIVTGATEIFRFKEKEAEI